MRQTDSQHFGTSALETPALAQLTTIGVGGPVDRFVEPQTEEEFIAAVRSADNASFPLLVIGGGSNLLISDEPLHGVVVRDKRHGISVLKTGIAVNETAGAVKIVAEAGANWDDFVAFCVSSGFSGVEGLSGVPGTVGASVVQNIGAYGQEVASSVSSVRVFDRKNGDIRKLSPDDMHFGYRSSALKSSMYSAPAKPADHYFPTPRYVVLSVTFTLQRSDTGEVAFGQLAKALGVEMGERMPIAAIRQAVLRVRALKGMLEDTGRYASRWMQGCKDRSNIAQASALQRDSAKSEGGAVADGIEEAKPDFDRHSCGSFFMNPILTRAQAATLPEDAPCFDAMLPDGKPGVKTSAAWLIDHAGFHKGYKVRKDAKAGLSTLHTLALTNRDGASAGDVAELAKTLQGGVEERFGVRLVPEPVVVGMDLR
ncbi:UDP-N-acetylmuramate dehydrogenase [Bifidobacterium sp. ESL0784]|uniref:UDP-N-acetylmuramate dehydrogenase n=1 Tax=Bifidobacterium sp. ESL0784 TaxID=2983231 RepID=UPI0023F8A2EE|nr:UDP-N-acetylmuramate dehydrogenase [Bifidobacterium sp. ESL0784]MDF7640420.1 UDP-N-acetylmuramate dehydrogenase [Bifidobacterium sp. ESL0784]